jgi:hypothetical protein
VITQIDTNSNAHLHHQQQQIHQQPETSEHYNVSLKYNPTVPEAGKSSLITIKITGNQTERRVKKFDLLHEKLMHVIIVSDDLSYFSHIHPIFDYKEGKFTVDHVFPETAKYKYG